MRPIRIFLFFVTILSFIFVLSVIFPEEGWKVSEDLTLRFFSFERMVYKDKPEYKDISGIIDSTSIDDGRHHSTKKMTWEDFLARDTLNVNDYPLLVSNRLQEDTAKLKEDSIRNVLHPIEFPKNNRRLLYSFFRKAHRIPSTNDLIRVLHFGDSQIEGDRITSYIRNELQQEFGGTGVGLFPARRFHFDHISLNMNLTENWRYYTINDKYRLPGNYDRFGILFGYSRFNRPSASEKDQIYKARIDIRRPEYSYVLARRYRTFRLFYSHINKPCIAQMTVGGKAMDAEIIEPTRELKVLTWHFNHPPQHFSLKFEGQDSPNVHAISLDNTSGVAVDNIPMRGSSGLEFTQEDPAFFNTMYNNLNVELILLQFGVNVVPDPKKDYRYYEKRLYRQLRFLKQVGNGVPIIVMGVSDMSRKLYGYYVSYPNIERIRDAQKRAAFKAGCGFWDVYKAMGGENSMPSWVFADPPLAQKDFTHFTYRGSKVIAEMFTNALMNEYRRYIKESR